MPDELKQALSGALERIEVPHGNLNRVVKGARRRRRQRFIGTGAACLVLGTVIIAAALQWDVLNSQKSNLATREGQLGQASWTETRSVAGLSVSSQGVPGTPQDVAVGQGSVWVLTCLGRCDEAQREVELLRIDKETGEVLRTLPVPGGTRLAFGFGSLWMIDLFQDALVRVDPETGQVESTLKLELPFEVALGDTAFRPVDLSIGAGALWVDTARGAVARVDPANATLAAVTRVPAPSPAAITAQDSGVWIAMGVEGVWQIEPTQDRVSKRIPVERGGNPIAVESVAGLPGAIWVGGTEVVGPAAEPVAGDGGTIARIDEASGVVTDTLLTGHSPQMAGDPLNLWVSDGEGILRRVDTSTGRFAGEPVDIQTPATALTSDSGTVWIIQADGNLLRISP